MEIVCDLCKKIYLASRFLVAAWKSFQSLHFKNANLNTHYILLHETLPALTLNINQNYMKLGFVRSPKESL